MVKKFFYVIFAYVKFYNKKYLYEDYRLMINEVINFLRIFKVAKRDDLYDIKDKIKTGMKNLYGVKLNETKDGFYFLVNDLWMYYFLKYAFFLEAKNKSFSLFNYFWFKFFTQRSYCDERLILKAY